MKRKLFQTLILAIITSALSSCEREQLQVDDVLSRNELTKTPSRNTLATFASGDEMRTYLNTVLALNLDQLREFEDQRGFSSFGRISDEIYFEADLENLKSPDDLRKHASKNQEYVRIFKEPSGDLCYETTFSSNYYQYVANKDRLFQVGGTIFKVFSDGLVGCDPKHVEELRKMSTIEMPQVESNEIFRMIPLLIEENPTGDNCTYNCGTYANALNTNNSERTKIELSISYFDYLNIYNQPQTEVQDRYLVRPYKKTLGVWYFCTRTLSCDIRTAVDVETTTSCVFNRTQHVKIEPGRSDSKLEYVYGGVISIGIYARYNMHYAGYKSWGDSPSTAPAVLNCNTFLIP